MLRTHVIIPRTNLLSSPLECQERIRKEHHLEEGAIQAWTYPKLLASFVKTRNKSQDNSEPRALTFSY